MDEVFEVDEQTEVANETVAETVQNVVSQDPAPAQPQEQPQNNVILITIVIASVILYLLYGFFFKSSKKRSGNSVLLLGPLGSGKTTMYFQLKEGSSMNGTVTSMEENQGTFRPVGADGAAGALVHFVDLPGHPRLRNKFEKYMRGAVGIVYVIDATDFLPHARDIAEQLYGLLANPVFNTRRVPLMLACNKVDMGTKAYTDAFIVKRIEKEIENLRSTQSALEGDAEGIIGKPGEKFSFQQLRSKVAVARVSALTGDVSPVYEFISTCVKA